MELNEQEAAVLRRKLESAEAENERLLKEIKDLLSYRDNKKVGNTGSGVNTKIGTISRRNEVMGVTEYVITITILCDEYMVFRF